MELGPIEILLILAVVVMVFGVGKLPEVGSALGKGIREFRSASRGDESVPTPDESKPEPRLQPEGVSCSVCGAVNAATVRFCTNCGRPMAPVAQPSESKSESPLQPESVSCSVCGAPNEATARFCTNCGRPMAPVAGA
jgi:sec-independent protein translocase protein TatA